jgi:L-fucose isomerase-like protein
MWDWEIANFLKNKGVTTLAPYNLAQAKTLCTALAAKRLMAESRFLIFQDNPGEGFQPDIFKCFYWWEQECTDLIKERFGVDIVRRSFKKLGADAKAISDAEAKQEWKRWDFPLAPELTERALLSAVKLYLAVKREIAGDPSFRGVGTNCLNESAYSDTTPCLAWNMLFEETGLIWACEGDTLSLLTKFLLHKSLGAPIMMTNIYPFLMGMAALKHEKIPGFPETLEEPENHLLLAHCGYFGLVPRSFCTHWIVRPPVLGIVDKNAHVFDARMPVGELTLAKLDTTLARMMVIEGSLRGYVQYPGSDCRNGAIVRVPDGHRLVKDMYSHHQLLMTGKRYKEIELVAPVFNLTLETIK